MMTLIIFFTLGVLLGAGLNSYNWKYNLRRLESINGKYKVVPFEWFWDQTFRKNGPEFHEAIKAYNKHKDEM